LWLSPYNEKNNSLTITRVTKMTILRILAAVFLPPLGVFLTVGLGGAFWINILLTVFGFYILGIVHAIWVIAKHN